MHLWVDLWVPHPAEIFSFSVPFGSNHQPEAQKLIKSKSCAGPWGRPGAREPDLGTGRGGDVTGSANSLSCQRAETVAGARGSPSETQRFGSDCDCLFTNR